MDKDGDNSAAVVSLVAKHSVCAQNVEDYDLRLHYIELEIGRVLLAGVSKAIRPVGQLFIQPPL